MPAVRIALAPFRLLRRLPGPVRIARSPAGPFLFLLLLWAVRAVLSLPAIDGATTPLPASDADALRLVHVQALAAGEAHGHVIHRVAPPQGLRPAFSALVDRAQASLLSALASHLPEPERKAQLFPLLWPQALALLAGLGLVALGLALGGVAGGHAAAVLAILMPAGPFAAGRLDDAGMQLVLLLPALALLARGWMKFSAVATGLGGLLLALAAMLSPFGLLAAIVAVVLLAAFLHVRIGRITRPVAAGLGIGLLAGGMIGHVAESLTRHGALAAVACNATGLNWAAAMSMAGLALTVAGLLPRRWQRAHRQRLWLLAPLLTLAPAVFAALAPACLKGPAGLADPQALHLLAREIGPAPSLIERAADPAFWLPAAWALAAMLIALALLRLRHETGAQADAAHARRQAFLQALGRRQALTLVMTVILALVVTALLDDRWSLAVLWPAAGLLAAGVAHALPRSRPAFVAVPALLLPAVLMSPLSLHLAMNAAMPISLTGLETDLRKAWLMPVHADGTARARLACLQTALHHAAADGHERAGLALAPARLGAGILLASRQPVLAVADARAGQALVMNARALTDEPALARARLLTLGASVIVHAQGLTVPRPDDRPERAAGLWQKLTEDEVPDWLEPAAAAPGAHGGNEGDACGLTVYHVQANRSLPPVIDVPAILLEGIAPKKAAGPVR